MKKTSSLKTYKAIKIILFWCLAACCILFASSLTKSKTSDAKYADFLKAADKVDVLIFGSSRILYSVDPVQMFDEYGITAYNMARHGGMTTDSYWMLVNALDYCDPECVIVDIWALDRQYHYEDVMDGEEDPEGIRSSISLLHEMLDFLPVWSKNRIRAIRDLIVSPEIRKEFYCDFILYHSRWDGLAEEDYQWALGKGEGDRLLGAGTLDEMLRVGLLPYSPEDKGEVLPENTVCLQYLHRIMELCDQKGIRLVLTYMPTIECYETDLQAIHTAEEISGQSGIPFLDLLHNNPTDPYTDMADSSHLNRYGMHKVTSLVGSFIKEHAALEDHRGEAGYELFEERVQQWRSSRVQRLLEESDLYQELAQIRMLLPDSFVFLRGGSVALQDPQVRRLIMQITGTDLVEKAAAGDGPYLLITDSSRTFENGKHYMEVTGYTTMEGIDTVLGSTTYVGTGDFGAVYLDGKTEENLFNMSEHFYDDVQIVITGAQGEILAEQYYQSGWQRAE